MRVLQLCNKPPSGNDGGALAIAAVTAGLLEAGCDVTVLAIETAKHPLTEPVFRSGIHNVPVQAVFVDTRVKKLPALLNLFNSRSYNIDRFCSAAFAAVLEKKLQEKEFDIIHLESLYMLPYLTLIRRYTQVPVVLRAHNVEHRLWQRQAPLAGSGWKKRYLRFLAARLERYEKQNIPRVSGIACITRDDETIFKQIAPDIPAAFIPYALPLPEPQQQVAKPNTVFHIGAMDWQPNVDGINWLLENVWPLIREQEPDAELHLAGRGMSDELRAQQIPGVFFHGEVPDAHAFMRSYSVMVVPLLSGGGMRVKVAEGLALGKALVSTATGAEGIAVKNGQHALLADDPQAFAAHVVNLLRNPQQLHILGQEAIRFAGENFDRTRITGKLLDFYSRLLADKS